MSKGICLFVATLGKISDFLTIKKMDLYGMNWPIKIKMGYGIKIPQQDVLFL